ncbi:MAG: hypothetical protein CL675_14075 [Bdellovibrionaceae bacterium]|nr:hypothetical protein [Pseudobdellovibrionaceae bacterium]
MSVTKAILLSLLLFVGSGVSAQEVHPVDNIMLGGGGDVDPFVYTRCQLPEDTMKGLWVSRTQVPMYLSFQVVDEASHALLARIYHSRQQMIAMGQGLVMGATPYISGNVKFLNQNNHSYLFSVASYCRGAEKLTFLDLVDTESRQPRRIELKKMRSN